MCMSENGNRPAGRHHANTGLYVRAQPGLKLRDKKVERLARKMRTVMLWLEESDLPTCRAWAELEVLSSRVYAELRDGGVINGEGEARRLLDDYRKLRQTQVTLSRELGMTPAARMAIKANGSRAPIDLAAALASEVEDVSTDNGSGRANDSRRGGNAAAARS
jgi:hypothetical protein